MSRDWSNAITANRDLWDKRMRAHLQWQLYPSDRVEDGTYVLTEPTRSELGDLGGRRVVHLQCNGGADTLALARLGATVTGVDFSREAVAEARRLAAATGIDATFVEADVYDLPDDLGDFDLVFTSMGVVWWLPDLDRWARVVAGLLRPGGHLHLEEIHPFASALAARGPRIEVGYPYFGNGLPTVEETTATYYAAPDDFAAEPGVEHGWVHTLGEIVTAVCRAGLRLEYLHEHDDTTYPMLEALERGADGLWRAPAGSPSIPLRFSLRARRASDGVTSDGRAG